MESKGYLENAQRDLRTGKWRMTFLTDEMPVEDLSGDLRISVKKWKDKRSLNANALLWKMLGDIARELQTDKWDVYLQMLKRYGKFTYVLVHPKAVEALKNTWRETEIVGDVDVNGVKAVQVLCYYGTSQMDSGEFSKLIDGVKSEMVEMGIEPPCSEDLRRAIENYERGQA